MNLISLQVLKTLLPLLIGLGVMACHSPQSHHAKAGSPPVSPTLHSESSPTFSSETIRAEVEGTKTPGVYHVLLSWREPEKGLTYGVQKKAVGGIYEGSWPTKENFFSDLVHHDSEASYRILRLGQHPKVVGEISLQIPRDLIVEGTWTAQQVKDGLSEKKPQRLFLMNGAQVVVGPMNLEVNVQELISEGGQFLAFLPPRQAVPEQSGRSAGQLQIHSRRARGHLHVDLSGEHGGPGLSGMNGAAGAAGVDAHQKCQKGGRGGDGASGADGTAGAAGGNGGTLLLQVENSKDFFIEADVSGGDGGTGGMGGLGGVGGRGGRGGPAWSTKDTDLCDEGAEGDRGIDGKNGLPGAAGQNGEMGRACWILNGISHGSCD